MANPGIVLGIPPTVLDLNQKGLLARYFYDGLFPNLAYRAEFPWEKWDAQTGQELYETRSGLMSPVVEPLAVGAEPLPQEVPYEQWLVQLNLIASAIDVHMPTSVTSNADLFLNKVKTFGLQAGQSVNRVARNAMFKAYLSGQSNLISAAVAGDTTLRVASLNGFTTVLNTSVSAKPQPVSPANPLAVTVYNGVTPIAANVIGCNADDPTDAYGPGTLYLQAALGGGGAPIRSPIVSVDAPTVIRSSGGLSVDSISASDTLQLQTIINAVAVLRSNNVSPHDDGYYHAHISPIGNAGMFADPVYQRLNQSLPEGAAYSAGFIGHTSGVMFYLNNEAPNPLNCGARTATGTKAYYSREIGAESTNNNGVNIGRIIITGQGMGYEKGFDESQYVSEAGLIGKVGEFDVVQNGIAVSAEHVRLYLRAPLDRLGHYVSAAWSITTAFAMPTDITAPSGPQRYKRALVVEFAQ
jgi:hypothetical protein